MNPALSSLHTVLFINLLKFLVKSVQISEKTETLLPCKCQVTQKMTCKLQTVSQSKQVIIYTVQRLQHSVFANSDLISVIQASKRVQEILNITL